MRIKDMTRYDFLEASFEQVSIKIQLELILPLANFGSEFGEITNIYNFLFFKFKLIQHISNRDTF